MKRLFLFIGTLLIFISACGSDDLKAFVSDFNKNADRYNIQLLDKDDFGEIEDEEYMSWRELYDSDDYSIDAKYEDGESLSGYYLVIDRGQPIEEFEGNGFKASLSIAKALGLDHKKFIRELGASFNEGSHSYVDKDYRVSFSYSGEESLTSVGTIINFDKQ